MTEEGGDVVERRMAILPQLALQLWLLCLILCEYWVPLTGATALQTSVSQ